MGFIIGIITYKKKLTNLQFSISKRMECRCLLGHLLITFACSSKPAGRVGDILGKLDRLFLDLAIWVEVEIPKSYVSRTCICVL